MIIKRTIIILMLLGMGFVIREITDTIRIERYDMSDEPISIVVSAQMALGGML